MQEFDVEIKNKKGSENHVVNHLSRLECIPSKDQAPIKEDFQDENVLELVKLPWYADFANYLLSGVIQKGLNHHQRKKFLHDDKAIFGKNHCYIDIVPMV